MEKANLTLFNFPGAPASADGANGSAEETLHGGQRDGVGDDRRL